MKQIPLRITSHVYQSVHSEFRIHISRPLPLEDSYVQYLLIHICYLAKEMDDLSVVVAEYKSLVVCVAESWLCANIFDVPVQLLGFNMFRKINELESVVVLQRMLLPESSVEW